MIDEDANWTTGLGRNVMIGVVLSYLVFGGLCLAAIGRLDLALAAAAVPAIFGGPYIGILITMRGSMARLRAIDASAVAAEVGVEGVEAHSVPVPDQSGGLIAGLTPSLR